MGTFGKILEILAIPEPDTLLELWEADLPTKPGLYHCVHGGLWRVTKWKRLHPLDGLGENPAEHAPFTRVERIDP